MEEDIGAALNARVQRLSEAIKDGQCRDRSSATGVGDDEEPTDRPVDEAERRSPLCNDPRD